MRIHVIACESGPAKPRLDVSATPDLAGRLGKTLRSVGRGLLTALHETRSARAARFIEEHRHLIDK